MVRAERLPTPNPMAPERRLTGLEWEAALAQMCDPHTTRAVVGLEGDMIVDRRKQRAFCTLALPRQGTFPGKVVQIPGMLNICTPNGSWGHLHTEPRRAVGFKYHGIDRTRVKATEYAICEAATHPFDRFTGFGCRVDCAATYLTKKLRGRRIEVLAPALWISQRMLKPHDRYADTEDERVGIVLCKAWEEDGRRAYLMALDDAENTSEILDRFERELDIPF